MTKPFAFDELLARIRARLRESDEASETTLEAGGIRLDLLTREATAGGHVGPPARARGGAARPPDAARRPGLHPRGDPLRGLGLRPRPRHQRRPGLHRLPAAQARPARLPGADRDRALGRLPTEGAAGEGAWGRLGLRGGWRSRSGRSSSLAFAFVFVAVRAEMAHESSVINREEGREARARPRRPRARRGPGDLADRRRPVRRRKDASCSPAGRPWSPPCSPATCSRRAPPPRCGDSPPPPPRSTPATSPHGSTSSPRDAGSCAPSPTPSTTCSTASTGRSPSSGSSSPTPPMSCAAR